MPFIFKRAERPDRPIIMGRRPLPPEPPVEPAILKPVEQPQIQPEMPEAVAEVQEILAAPESEDGSIHNEVIQPPKKKRGRPRKEKIDG